MKHPKHLILFGNASNAFKVVELETGERIRQYSATIADLGNNIVIEEDLTKTYNTATLELPAIKTEFLDTIDLKKYDVFKIYFKYFDTKEEADNANIEDLHLIFNGYVAETPMSESKTTGLVYPELRLRSTSSLLYESATQIDYFSGDLNLILETADKYSSLFAFIPKVEIDKNIKPTWVFNVSGGNFLGPVLDNLRKDYALHIFQKPNGNLFIGLPSSFDLDRQHYIMDVHSNVRNIDYGDVTQNVDCIIVLGTNCLGIAFDPIAYQMKQGVLPKNLKPSVVPDKSLLNPRMIFRRDLFNEEDCQRIAREQLLEMGKNYAITIDCLYDPLLGLGDTFIVTNSQRIKPNQIWVVKNKSTSISKSGAAVMTITGYSNSIIEFPEDIVLSPEGVFDTDILELSQKVDNVTRLHLF